jgi:Fur family ferric uptake transcriptional regulator
MIQSELKFRYDNFIQTNKLKSSKRRDLIFNYLTQIQDHFTADEIYQALLKIDPEIGIATVYRTIRLLIDCGVLLEHTFGEKKGFFEVIDMNSRHHDHLICNACGKIIEFQCDTIEDDKQRIAEQHQFKIESHKLEIYGVCSECQQQSKTIISKQ